MSTDSERYVFEAEWHDKVACITRKFLLYYYLTDNSVELVRIIIIIIANYLYFIKNKLWFVLVTISMLAIKFNHFMNINF